MDDHAGGVDHRPQRRLKDGRRETKYVFDELLFGGRRAAAGDRLTGASIAWRTRAVVMPESPPFVSSRTRSSARRRSTDGRSR